MPKMCDYCGTSDHPIDPIDADDPGALIQAFRERSQQELDDQQRRFDTESLVALAHCLHGRLLTASILGASDLERERDQLARLLAAESARVAELSAGRDRVALFLDARAKATANANDVLDQHNAALVRVDEVRPLLAEVEPRRFEDSAELDAAAPIDAIAIDEKGRAWQRLPRWDGDDIGCWGRASTAVSEVDSSDLLTEHGTITLIHAPKP